MKKAKRTYEEKEKSAFRYQELAGPKRLPLRRPERPPKGKGRPVEIGEIGRLTRGDLWTESHKERWSNTITEKNLAQEMGREKSHLSQTPRPPKFRLWRGDVWENKELPRVEKPHPEKRVKERGN